MKKTKMKSKGKNTRKPQSESGILTLDFIFSVMAVYAIGMVFVLLAFTLMFSSVVQYMAFSISRAHISGDLDISKQQEAGILKMNEWFGSKYTAKFVNATEKAWFKVESTGVAEIVPYVDFTNPSAGSTHHKPYGIRVKFTSNLLKKIRLPMLGSPSDGTDESFGVANIYSFLYREPSAQECLDFNKARWRVIKERFPNITSMPDYKDAEYGAQADNGC